MIQYTTGRYGLEVLFTCAGSVFPRAGVVAFVPAFFTVVVRVACSLANVQLPREVLPLTLYNTFTAVLGFVVVFRTSIAYSRYWEGINSLRTMAIQWYDVAAGVTAFAETSPKPKAEVKAFQSMICRLICLMHCFALQEVAQMENEDFDILDLDGMDLGLLNTLHEIDEPRVKMEKIFQWLQISILDAINNKMITTPPPIVSRSFAQLNAGMVAFEQMRTISFTPFPFPYTQMVGCLLVVHSLITPLLLGSLPGTAGMAQSVSTVGFAFIQVFALASLNLTAAEIEQPFGDDPNDLDIAAAQEDMNHSLKVLLKTHTQALMTCTPLNVQADGEPKIQTKTLTTVVKLTRERSEKATVIERNDEEVNVGQAPQTNQRVERLEPGSRLPAPDSQCPAGAQLPAPASQFPPLQSEREPSGVNFLAPDFQFSNHDVEAQQRLDADRELAARQEEIQFMQRLNVYTPSTMEDPSSPGWSPEASPSLPQASQPRAPPSLSLASHPRAKPQISNPTLQIQPQPILSQSRESSQEARSTRPSFVTMFCDRLQPAPSAPVSVSI